jgi:hypothetical protein
MYEESEQVHLTKVVTGDDDGVDDDDDALRMASQIPH